MSPSEVKLTSVADIAIDVATGAVAVVGVSHATASNRAVRWIRRMDLEFAVERNWNSGVSDKVSRSYLAPKVSALRS